MSDLGNMIKCGVTAMWERDGSSQEKFCRAITDARGMLPVDFRKYGCAFLPNDEYLARYCGQEIRAFEYGCYSPDGQCLWNNNLIFPISDASGSVVGLGGFDPIRYVMAHERQDWSIIYYQYSGKRVLKKGRFLYLPGITFHEALEQGYLCVVDGLFDAISLSEAGFCAGALMGSSLTNEIILQLRFLRNVIVIADNDAAGEKLRKEINMSVRGSVSFSQSVDKDIDGALKSDRRDEIIARLQKMIARLP